MNKLFYITYEYKTIDGSKHTATAEMLAESAAKAVADWRSYYGDCKILNIH